MFLSNAWIPGRNSGPLSPTFPRPLRSPPSVWASSSVFCPAPQTGPPSPGYWGDFGPPLSSWPYWWSKWFRKDNMDKEAGERATSLGLVYCHKVSREGRPVFVKNWSFGHPTPSAKQCRNCNQSAPLVLFYFSQLAPLIWIGKSRWNLDIIHHILVTNRMREVIIMSVSLAWSTQRWAFSSKTASVPMLSYT